jgi:hypothetical protein
MTGIGFVVDASYGLGQDHPMDYQKILSEAGRKGGLKRAEKLTKIQLTRIAMKGVRARLEKKSENSR